MRCCGLNGGIGFDVVLMYIISLCCFSELSEFLKVFLLMLLNMMLILVLFVSLCMCFVMFLWL